MIYLQAFWLVIVAVIFSLIENSYALSCWKCSSDLDSTCRDYFNTTQIIINQRRAGDYHYGNVQPARNDPTLAECDGMHTSTLGQLKNVCLKRVLLVRNGPKQVIRECVMVPRDSKVGTCPEDYTYGSNRNLEYCGTCEGHGCNSAGRNSLVFLGLMPAIIMLLGI